MNAFIWNGIPVFKYQDKFITFNQQEQCFAQTNQIQNFKDLPASFYYSKSNDSNLDFKSVNLYFVLTRRCNLSCRYCAAYAKSEKVDMESNLIVDALRFVERHYEPKEWLIKISGGEPTQNARAIKLIVEESRKYGIDPSYIIGTNGVIENDVLSFLLRSNFSFQVSCDGWPEIQNENRPLKKGGASAPYVLRTIKVLTDHKARFKVRSVITDKTVKLMPKLVQYFAGLGVNYLAFSTVGECIRACDSNVSPPTPSEYVDYFIEALDKAKEMNVSLELPFHLFRPSVYFCPNVSGRELVFSSEGYISRCPFVLDKDSLFSNPFIIGRYDRNRRNFEINTKKKERIDCLNSTENRKCFTCFAQYYCGSGCRARHMLSDGNHNFAKIDPKHCQLTRELSRRLLIRLYEESTANRGG
jgi:radical SAM protein with 4Fe4S-binding SPASM domain